MQNLFRYFGGSIVFTLIALGTAFWLGFSPAQSIAAGFAALFTATLLGVLETSLSFDNAVVNAKVLATMSPFWRKMFLTVGMIIAVFGMRVVFPLVIVWAVSSNSFWDVIGMTWKNPAEFQKILVDQHILIAGFGGAFLWMVFTRFFFDTEKDTHWLGWIERSLARAGKIEAVWITVTMLITFAFYKFIPHGAGNAFVIAAMLGVLTFLIVEGFSSLMESGEDAMLAEGTVTRAATGGFAAFMYLEVLDASFSFDGVIGAFAITNNIFIIALGLGIGAMFVRSLTIKLVDDGTLAKYEFLEHGAFWAIGALSLIMYLGATGLHIPEVVSGTIGIVLIGLSFWSSLRANRHTAES